MNSINTRLMEKNYILILTLIALLMSINAHMTYQQEIPNGDNVYHLGVKWPGVGHTKPEGSGLRNPFGEDFATNGRVWSVEFCRFDSDGDGFTNGQELGDPDCIWKVGDVPTRVVDITHPGYPPEDLTDADCLLEVPDEKIVTMTFNEFHVPSAETNYMCVGFELPSDEVYHAVKFRPIVESRMEGEERHIPNDFVHHMVMYICDSPQEYTDPINCSSMKSGCDSVFYAWGVGGDEFCLPEKVGLVFGKDEAKHVSLQIHYNNKYNLDNIYDSSGVQVVFTSTHREFDGNIISLGASIGSIRIPPGEEDHEVIGTCEEKSTKALPTDLNVATSFLHMHQLGAKIWTSVIRDEKIVGSLGKNENYDFSLQKTTKLDPPVVILPGDRLETHCIYNSTDRDEMTYGGESTTSEMCFNFVLVYPRIDASSCIDKTTNGHLEGNNMITPIVIIILLVVLVAVTIFIIMSRKKSVKVSFE